MGCDVSYQAGVLPSKRYALDTEKDGFQYDTAQASAVAELDDLFQAMTRSQGAAANFLTTLKESVSGWFRRPLVPEPSVKGLYFWGGVGRGKTYLMDLFYEALPGDRKMRTHFHRFMRRVHHELTILKEEKNPLEIVAKKIASEVDIVCFDEFFVSDITDAMILANLLEGLFSRGVVLVATSNIQPDGLYENGLQRERFLPAIKLLNQYTKVVNVDGGTDYRLRALKQASLFYTPSDEEAIKSLNACFHRLIPEASLVREDVTLDVEGRSINALKVADDVVWFSFDAICDGPRSQHDYIELAREYHAVVVSDVPVLGAHNEDKARRFIYLVDEFYDRNVKLILSGEAAISHLYAQGKLGFEFQRTMSRLLEMQSEEYLSQPHKA